VKKGAVVQLLACTKVNGNTGAWGNCSPISIPGVKKKYAITQVGSTADYTVSIPTTLLPSGHYEAVLTTHYNFNGLVRTWYQATGFTIA
jgi:hypothetical protein